MTTYDDKLLCSRINKVFSRPFRLQLSTFPHLICHLYVHLHSCPSVIHLSISYFIQLLCHRLSYFSHTMSTVPTGILIFAPFLYLRCLYYSRMSSNRCSNLHSYTHALLSCGSPRGWGGGGGGGVNFTFLLSPPTSPHPLGEPQLSYACV